ncbi:MAG TPA: M12 family metallo-peptidase [Phycisphaerae bacterium]|nr:M12 family metallo-peptidase [Phycisphaerae bacterium]
MSSCPRPTPRSRQWYDYHLHALEPRRLLTASTVTLLTGIHDNIAYAGQSFDLSCFAVPQAGGLFPYGTNDTVAYYDGEQLLGTAPVDTATGFSKLNVQFPTAGVHHLRALFSGDPDLDPGQSTLNLQVLPATRVDLLVLYTSDLTGIPDSGSNPADALGDVLAQVNDAFFNSYIPVFINIVHAQSINYSSSGHYDDDYDHLADPTDGIMDNVAALRQQYQADLVTLLVKPVGAPGAGDAPNTEVLGIGAELISAKGNAAAAFSVVHWNNQLGDETSQTLAHELGHNFGASHDAANNSHKNPAFPSGQGYRFTAPGDGLVHDLMSYDPGTTENFFSNPDLVFEGVPAGIKGKADAAHVIMKTAPIVAAYFGGAPAPSTAPRGKLEVKNRTVASGWAFDADAGGGGTAPIAVQLFVDGVPTQIVNADLDRPDLQKSLGSTAHGFSFDLSAIGPGNHSLSIYAVNAPTIGGTQSEVLLGTYSMTNPPPTASIEVSNIDFIRGWAFDKEHPDAAVMVNIYEDGIPSDHFPAGDPRPDLVKKLGSADHGFTYNLHIRDDIGTHKIDIYLYKPGFEDDPILYRSLTIKTTDSSPTGKLEIKTGTHLSGWAFDANAGPDALPIAVFVGDREFDIAADQPRPDLANALGSPNHGFSFDLPTDFPVGTYTVSVRAGNTPGETTALIGQYKITNHAPKVTLQIANATTVAGYAQDPDSPLDPVDLHVDLDGTFSADLTANIHRADLVKALGSADHGFTLQLPSGLTDGPHTLSLYMFDRQSGQKILVRTLTVKAGNVLPTGKVETASATTLSGWAFDQNLGTDPAFGTVEIDGVVDGFFTADQPRSDLLPPLGSTAHGFTYSLSLAPGRHTISVKLSDDGSFVLLKTLTVTV